MANLPQWAVVYWVRFERERTAAELDLAIFPAGCLSWKAGPDLPASGMPARSASAIWCAIASFSQRVDAEAAFHAPPQDFGDGRHVAESWRALLVPFAHRGECNHVDPDTCGPLFDIQADPGGPLFVMTTAGFHLRAKSDFMRLIDFRRRVEAMRPTIEAAEGNLAHQVFAPHTAGDDGITMSLWRDDRSMFSFAYRPGAHRIELDRQNSHRTVDRSSFTRFRVVCSAGGWGGTNPIDPAAEASG